MPGDDWTKEEDEKFVHLYNFHNGEWNLIWKEMTGRTESGCKKRLYRHHRDLLSSHPRWPWTYNEERVLMALKHNKPPPSELARYLPGRNVSGYETRQRRLNKGQSPYDSSGQHWTSQEDETLVEQRKANKSWDDISTNFGDTHSATDCRTRWYDNFWEEFNNSIVNDDFDLEKYKEELKKRPGVIRVRYDEWDSEEDAEGDTDYEVDGALGEGEGTDASDPERNVRQGQEMK